MKPQREGIHGLFQMLIGFPELIRWQWPNFKRGTDLMIPCQREDELVLAEAFSKLRPLKYLDRRRFAHGLLAFKAMVQPNLERRAFLRSWALLKLRPLEDFGLQMES